MRPYPCPVQPSDLATRRLTFLFADVEGSTRLAELHGAAAGTALARYHELVAAATVRHGGRIFERIGDGAYASFDEAAPAVSAAVQIQEAIGSEHWGEIGRLRVRIGLLAGEVEEVDGRYYGRPLFRAARLQDLARGGETLLAASTAEGIANAAPEGAILRDMDVVGEAENGREAVAAAERLAPDVVLMDLLMPEMGGLEAIAAIKAAHPEIEIVAVTSFIEEEKVTSALEAGGPPRPLHEARGGAGGQG